MLMSGTRMFCLLMLALWPVGAGARVVINEIFYHAPGDIEDLKYVELHNSGEDAVELGGWKFTKGLKFAFPAGARIEAKGFLVLCRNEKRFRQFYKAPVAGTFDSKLSNNGERLELSDARGRIVDTVKYQDNTPWPLGADGLSGSLERICPDSGGDNAVNWASSPLSPDRTKPAGTPGKVNANYSEELPPVISKIVAAPEQPAANQPFRIEASVRDAESVAEVKLLYRVAGSGYERPEMALAMKEISEGRFAVEIPGQAEGQLIRYRVQATGAGGAKRMFPAVTEPRPALSAFVHASVEPAKIPFGWIIHASEAEFKAAQGRAAREAMRGVARGMFGPGRGGERGDKDAVPSGQSAFVYFDPATNRWEVFDFVEVEPRKGGTKVHFAKGQLLQGMSTVNLLFEGDIAALVEPLAYEVYHRAGMAAPQSWHVRLWQDGQPLGYHALIEQPNRAFLRRNKIKDDGNLYKLLWYEDGVADQHEKKTNVRGGHNDLLALVNALKKNKGDALWTIIRTNFDVVQAVNYFAVNTVLSHWDGFFNNYFTYHDTGGTGRWTMYPWDQDQTWGVVNMRGRSDVFCDLPITFGMDGDAPPGRKPGATEREQRFGPGPGFGGRGAMWWRPPGYFSGPLLANAQFRKLFLARTKEILETVYTEEGFGPVIDALGEHLKPEARLRAGLLQQEPDRAAQSLEQNVQRLHEHLKKRREFLLAQEEIKSAGKFSTAGLEVPQPKKKKSQAPASNP